jgi:hypothetical protein
MKRIIKFIFFIIITAILILFILNLILSLFINKLVVGQLEKSLNVPISLKRASIALPLLINLDGLKIGDLFSSERVSVSPNILGLMSGRVVLNSITLINPVITLEQSRIGKFNVPEVLEDKNPPALYIMRLLVKDGRFVFIDKKTDPKGFKVTLSRVNMDISKVMLPITSLKANFKITADVLKGLAGKIGEVSLLGWVDFGSKDMDATLTLKDLDASYFYPYYGNFLSERKVTFAKLNLKVKAEGEDNDLNISTNLRLSDLVYEEDKEGSSDALRLDFAKKALDFFTDEDGNIILDFYIKIKLDKPNISQEEIKKIILKAAAKNIASQEPENLIKKVNENIRQFKDFGKEMQKVFKGKE